MIGNVVELAVGGVPPAVVGAADGIALYLPAVGDDDGALAGGEVGAHVGAVGVQHHHLAALSAIQGKVLAEEAHRQRPLVQFIGLRDHKPAPWEGVGSQPVFMCLSHSKSPVVFSDWRSLCTPATILANVTNCHRRGGTQSAGGSSSARQRWRKPIADTCSLAAAASSLPSHSR